MEVLWSTYLLPGTVIIIVFAFLCSFIYKRIEVHVWRIPPGPLGIPILGYVPFLSKDKVHEDLAELNAKYGRVCSFTAGFKRVVVVFDYETAKALLSHKAALDRPPDIFNIIPEGGGFAEMNGLLWEQERRFMMNAVKNVGLGGDTWNEIAQESVAEFVSYITDKQGQPMNVSGPLAHYAVTNMSALLFGRQFIKKRPNSELVILDEGYKVFKKHMSLSNPVVLFPWLLKYFIKFNINGYRQKSKTMELACQVLRKEIVKRLTDEHDEYSPSSDLIKSYIQHSLKEDSSTEEINCAVNYLIGHLSFYLSTSDSSTTPTEFLLLIMAAYPKVQTKVHKEIDDVVGRGGLISWNDSKKFPYSLACIKEMMRWVTIAPISFPRCASETFEFHGYTIPKGTAIIANTWGMHRDPKYWKNPTEYIPERFLCSEEKELIKVKGYGTFSFGKRSCPGENTAMMILFHFFLGIMQKFTIKTATGGPPNLSSQFEFTMKPTWQELCFIKR